MSNPYDPSGRRIEKSGNGEAIKYCYDGDHVIAEYDGNDRLLRKYIHGARIDEPVFMLEVTDSNAVYYYHFDGLGSVVALSDSNGDSCQSYEYTVYGQVAAEDPDHPNPYMFTGRQFDIETGLYYYRARYYNPHIGRFMQTDPVGYEAGMNLYLYCKNNPLIWVDYSGLMPTNSIDPCDVPGLISFADPCADSNFCVPDDNDWIITSVIATILAWADALGICGDFGRWDTFDMNYLYTLINPYPNAGPEGVKGDQEGFWAKVHYGVGAALGLIGVDRESAENLMRTWEITEPGIWSGWGAWGEYQGRDKFEEGEKGMNYDIERGLQGYDDAGYWKQYFEIFF